MRVHANAKLTLSLRVTGVRDDGYHLLESEMVTLDLADTLDIAEGDDGLVVSGPAATSVPAAGDNLVAQALAAVGRRASIRLEKRIPAGAGLGGGSADAAAVLRWAGCDDLVLAAGLGADVPFCLRGGRAMVRGIGEQLEPLPFEDQELTLVLLPFGVDTAAVYREWDAQGGPRGENRNDLEPAALAVEPRLGEWRERVAVATGQRPRLAGSGSTWFVAGDISAEAAARLAPAQVVAARTTPAVALL